MAGKMRFWICLACTSLAAAAVLSVLPVRGEGEIYRDVLRLRVIAASDGDEDQADKLAVRDGVLSLLEKRIGACRSREEAESLIAEAEGEILDCAVRTLEERGRKGAVSLKIGWERSPRRDYGDAVLPAGTYRTLCMEIGEAAGQNWWCVLFPGVCLRYAEAREESIAVGLTPEEYRIITRSDAGKVKIRFWVLEKLAELTGRKLADDQ